MVSSRVKERMQHGVGKGRESTYPASGCLCAGFFCFGGGGAIRRSRGSSRTRLAWSGPEAAEAAEVPSSPEGVISFRLTGLGGRLEPELCIAMVASASARRAGAPGSRATEGLRPRS